MADDAENRIYAIALEGELMGELDALAMGCSVMQTRDDETGALDVVLVLTGTDGKTIGFPFKNAARAITFAKNLESLARACTS